MFAKLLKHEFHAQLRIVPFIYLATAVMIIINLVMRAFDFQALSTMMLILLILFGVVEIIMTYVVVIYRYYKNLYSNEGYLTLTMPVKPRQLLASKAVVAFIWLLISYILMAGVVLTVILISVGDLSGAPMNLSQMINQFLALTGLQASSFYIIVGLFGALLIMTIVEVLAQVYFCITFGNLSRFHRLGIAAPILTYLALYLINQALALLFGVIIPLGATIENGVLKFVPQGMLDMILNPTNATPVVGLGSFLVGIVEIFVLFIVTSRLLTKNTSLK